MNAIRATQALNKRELESATPVNASWHTDYRDTAYIYVGGLPLDLTEGDVVTIFSQFGNPTHLKLVRDRETGKSKGFGFLKYEDQRSCDLAVDNLGGAEVLGRLLRVDHTRYKIKDGEDEETWRIERMERETGEERPQSDEDVRGDGEHSRKRRKKTRHMLKEEKELEEMLAITQDGEEADPMRDYLIKEKREEVEQAKEREKRRKHKHHHRRRHDDGSDEEGNNDDTGRRHRRGRERSEERKETDRRWRRDQSHKDHGEDRSERHRHNGHERRRRDGED
ncbi:hypothetical protein PV10_05915 [Exophiala mesophila]|uniref:RRM domain-containing protein n=1 Tax=Exophiala mesophila TaxID=212818 RepID=A0A0D1WQJ6_EXOME|nr:uncharacterized protein PV10_05915 [Exophiala mesophila]KIV91370.1 hypothetical protein PV10_05915 [Exophiala mesophila]